MKIIRFQDASGSIAHAAQQEDGSALIIEGDIFGSHRVTDGKAARNVSKEKAFDYILGYTCANDVSARDWQKNGGGGQWCRGKTFDTFCPLGPVLVTTDDIPNPNTLAIKTVLNGETVQDWNTSPAPFRR